LHSELTQTDQTGRIADPRPPTGREKMRHVMHDCG
jgi:hypothetical protein